MFTPRDAQEAWRFAKSTEKAVRLFTEDGYTLQPLFDANFPGVYMVSSPAGNSYTVDLSKEQPSCNCPDFVRNGVFCKHGLAVEMELARQEDAHYDAMAAHYCTEY